MTARRLFVMGFLIVLIDQTSKYVVMWANYPHIVNQGFSFGFGRDGGARSLGILSGVLIIDFIRRTIRFPDTLIIAGGASNVLDRLIHGGVIDWIKVWTVWFNIADISITAGVLWMMITMIIGNREAT